MGIGVSVFLMAVGAIFAFAVKDSIQGLDLVAVGYILMIAGVLGLALTLFIFGPRSRASSGAVVEERRVYDDRI